MITVHKFELQLDKCQQIEMPWGSRILKIGEQQGKLMIWALVDTTNGMAYETFKIFGTGSNIDINDKMTDFLGTVLMSDGYVWHVFKVR